MALSHSPSIVTNGLVLCLDAANLKGYDKYENLTLQTSQIGLTPTYSVSGIVGLNTTATTAPNGLYEASLVDNNGNTATNYVYGSAGLTTNTTYTYSIHIKQGTKPDFWITIDENGFGGKRYYSSFTYSNESVTTGITGNTGNDGALIGSSVSKLTNGWYRLSLAFKTSTTAVSTFVDMINRFGNTSGSNYVWGRQLEIGDTTTDYYATTSSVKNRGTIWSDLSGRGNTGTLTNGVRYNNSNIGSFVFDGTNDYIEITNNDLYKFSNTQAFSLNLWVRCTAVTGGSTLLSFALTSGRGYYFTLDINGLRTNSFLFDYWDGTPFRGILGNDNSITMNNWIMLTATSSSNSVDDMKVYQNGVLTSYTNRGTGTPSTINYDTLSMRIGSRGDGGYFSGNISQVSIYNRALTAAEIQQNFNALKGRFGI